MHYGQLENREWSRVHVSKIKKRAFLHQDNTLDQAKTLTLNLCDPETVIKFHQVNPVLNSVEMVSTHLEPAESDVAGPLECANFDQVNSFSAADSSKPMKKERLRALSLLPAASVRKIYCLVLTKGNLLCIF